MFRNQVTNFFIARSVTLIARAVADTGMMRRAVPALADRSDSGVLGTIELREHVPNDIVGEPAIIVHNEKVIFVSALPSALITDGGPVVLLI